MGLDYIKAPARANAPGCGHVYARRQGGEQSGKEAPIKHNSTILRRSADARPETPQDRSDSVYFPEATIPPAASYFQEIGFAAILCSVWRYL